VRTPFSTQSSGKECWFSWFGWLVCEEAMQRAMWPLFEGTDSETNVGHSPKGFWTHLDIDGCPKHHVWKKFTAP